MIKCKKEFRSIPQGAVVEAHQHDRGLYIVIWKDIQRICNSDTFFKHFEIRKDKE